MFSEFMAAVQEGRELSRADITRVVSLLAGAEAAASHKADFLAAMAAKGETAAEIAGFAAELRALSVPLPFDPADVTGEVLDVCGTGGGMREPRDDRDLAIGGRGARGGAGLGDRHVGQPASDDDDVGP